MPIIVSITTTITIMAHNVKVMETLLINLLDKEDKLPFKIVVVNNYNNVIMIQNVHKTFNKS